MGERKFRFNDLGNYYFGKYSAHQTNIFFKEKGSLNFKLPFFYLVIPFNNPEIIACLGVAEPLGLMRVLGI